ncbi:MAG: filamentous hemagglutinin N-terminal domain-containing protein, partial [Betaproteobacteria bacterium]|nr:filamentous hemagglutinin N-terminal domain-containing protein [Betaproteobacteria bacterium]
MTKFRRNKLSFNRKVIAVGVAACFATDLALANPSGPAVVNGTVSFQRTGNLLQITNSPNAIINWQSFSIGAAEITRFLQQSASSAVLNRVITQNPSSILGALQSNGRVFLINPNGIVFGA